MSLICVDKVEEVKVPESDIWVVSGLHKRIGEPFPDVQFRIPLYKKGIKCTQYCTKDRLISFHRVDKWYT